MHLSLDLSVAYNSLLDSNKQIAEIRGRRLSASRMKRERDKIAHLLSQQKLYMRMCLLCCVNLLEAYVNGIAWEYRQLNDLSSLSNNQRRMIEGDQTSILDKLVKVPMIVTGAAKGALTLEEPPLSEFRDIVKPFRDSIVHASPYSAPERYGGYDKLSKICDLDFEIVEKAVGLSLEIIGTVHRFIGGSDEYPQWLPHLEGNGYLTS